MDGLNIMKLNDIPHMKKLTGTKVVYNVYFDTQKRDVMESAGTLTERAVRDSIWEEIMELSEGGCYIPALLLVRPEWADIIMDEYNACREQLYQ